MKKLSSNKGLGVILALSFLSSCSDKIAERPSNTVEAKPTEIRTTVIKEPVKEEPIIDSAEPVQASLPCKTEDDCALVPNGDCFGCLKPNGSHYVTTQQQASQMWEQKRATCGPQLEQFFKSLQGKQPEMSQHQSCRDFNGVACQQGQCVGAHLNEAQLKARGEKIQKLRQQMQNQQGQGGQGQPQNGGHRQPMNGGQGGH